MEEFQNYGNNKNTGPFIGTCIFTLLSLPDDILFYPFSTLIFHG